MKSRCAQDCFILEALRKRSSRPFSSFWQPLAMPAVPWFINLLLQSRLHRHGILSPGLSHYIRGPPLIWNDFISNLSFITSAKTFFSK